MSEFKTVVVRGSIMTNKVGSECEFEFEAEVEAELDGEELENALEEEARESAFELMEWNFTVEEK